MKIDSLGNWGIAICASLIAHVVVLTTFAITGTPSSQTEQPKKPETEQVQPPVTPVDGPSEAQPEDTVAKRGPEPRRITTPAPAGSSSRPLARPQVTLETASYKVKAGDNATRLARDNGVTLQVLAKLNGKDVKTFSNLRVGQTIKVPAKSAPAETR